MNFGVGKELHSSTTKAKSAFFSRVNLGTLWTWIYHASKKDNYAKNANSIL